MCFNSSAVIVVSRDRLRHSPTSRSSSSLDLTGLRQVSIVDESLEYIAIDNPADNL